MEDTSQVMNNVRPVVTEYTIYRLNEHRHWHGYVIGDVSCLPVSSYLILTWDTFCSTLGVPPRSISVEFTEVVSHAVLRLEGNGAELVIGIQKASGRFEISSEEVTVMSGIIKAVDNVNANMSDLGETDGKDVAMNSETVYRVLALRGYSYRGKYRIINSINSDMTRATLKVEDYDLVIESIFQMMLMMKEEFHEIMYIQNLIIDVNKENDKNIVFNSDYNIFKCGGVEVKDIVLKKSSTNKYMKLRIQTIVCKQEEKLKAKKPDIVTTNNSIPIKVVYVTKADRTEFYNDTFDVNDGWTGFSGTSADGSGVMGVLRRGSSDDVTVVDPDLMWPVPPHWTIKEAVTVPLVYIQALYLLRQVGHVNKYRSVLINGVTSLTLALVNVLLKYQKRIFINSENQYQRDIIQTLYRENNDVIVCDQWEVEHVVGGETLGAGCHLGNTPHIGVMKCVAADGCYLHVRDDNAHIPLDELTSLFVGKSFKGISIKNIFKDMDKAQKKFYQKTILNGICEDCIRPLPHFTVNNIPETTDSVVNIVKLPEVKSVCRLEEGCYVVVCGRKNFGIHIVDKLISMGADKITINTPEPTLEYLQVQLQKWRLKGIQLKICSENFISTAACLTLLSRASELGHVRGVFATCPTRDVPGNHFGESQLGVTRLDTVTKRICQHLKYFVIFTAMPKHNAPECSLESIFHHRDLDNLPILEIKCLENDTKSVNDESVLIEVLSQSLSTALKDLHTLLPHKLCVVTYSYPETIQGEANHNTKEDIKSTYNVSNAGELKDVPVYVTKNTINRRGLYFTEISMEHMAEQQETISSKDCFTENIKVQEPEVSDLKFNGNCGPAHKLCQKMALGDMKVEDIIHRKTDNDENLIS